MLHRGYNYFILVDSHYTSLARLHYISGIMLWYLMESMTLH